MSLAYLENEHDNCPILNISRLYGCVLQSTESSLKYT